MKILIATDGSPFSERAIERVCEIGADQWTDPSFRIVSVHEPQVPIATEPFAAGAEFYEELDRIARERASKDAEAAVERLKKQFNDCPIETVVEIGRPAQVIVESAETWGADLVVVGSHGRGFWGRLGLGSVSDAVLHHSPCSVLVVKSPRKSE
jgi:nucleotide-binding universal stress UspA family protein